MSWVLMQHHIKAVILMLSTQRNRGRPLTRQKYLNRNIIRCLSFMILCLGPEKARLRYIKIFLNRINEFKHILLIFEE
jgi:hypothetical protein